MTADIPASLAFLWLLYLEILGGEARLQRAAEVGMQAGSARAMGMQFGVLLRYALVFFSGLCALEGSFVAFAVFVFLELWAALVVARRGAERFVTGFERTRSPCPRGLGNAVGAAVVAVTRGVPLAVLTYAVITRR